MALKLSHSDFSEFIIGNRTLVNRKNKLNENQLQIALANKDVKLFLLLIENEAIFDV